MRISDWSSDVCSADLIDRGPGSLLDDGCEVALVLPLHLGEGGAEARVVGMGAEPRNPLQTVDPATADRLRTAARQSGVALVQPRSAACSVGNECVKTCRFRWSRTN